MAILKAIIECFISNYNNRKNVKKLISLINRGMVVGKNFHMFNSEIDWEYCNLITIGDNVKIS